MQQVKFFKCLGYDSSKLETEINQWIRDNQVKIVDIKIQLSPPPPGAGLQKASAGQSELVCLVVYEGA